MKISKELPLFAHQQTSDDFAASLPTEATKKNAQEPHAIDTSDSWDETKTVEQLVSSPHAPGASGVFVELLDRLENEQTSEMRRKTISDVLLKRDAQGLAEKSETAAIVIRQELAQQKSKVELPRLVLAITSVEAKGANVIVTIKPSNGKQPTTEELQELKKSFELVLTEAWVDGPEIQFVFEEDTPS